MVPRRAGCLVVLALGLAAAACAETGTDASGGASGRPAQGTAAAGAAPAGGGSEPAGAGGGMAPLDAGVLAPSPLPDASSTTPGDAIDAASPDAAAAAPDAGDATCVGATLCTGFEDLPPGALSGTWSSVAPDCSGDGTARVDDAVARSGTRSIRVDSSGGYCNHVFATPALDASSLGAELWVRVYVRFAEAFGPSHTTFLAMHDAQSDTDLRMGGQSGILMWNRESDDATLPELSPTGIAMSVSPPAESWLCIELYLDGAGGGLQTYVDGTLVPGLVVDDVATADVDGQWLRPGPWSVAVTDLRLGWESYGDQGMSLWFDDLVVASQRPGC